MKKMILIIIKHWKAELKEFARDAMNEIKDILFREEPQIDGRKAYISDAFVWAKVYASLDDDENWKPEVSMLEHLKADAMRIADGTWQSYHERPALLKAAIEIVVKVFSEPQWRYFTRQEAKTIETFIRCDGGNRNELFDEVWNNAKPRLNCNLTTALDIFNEMKNGQYIQSNSQVLSIR